MYNNENLEMELQVQINWCNVESSSDMGVGLGARGLVERARVDGWLDGGLRHEVRMQRVLEPEPRVAGSAGGGKLRAKRTAQAALPQRWIPGA